MKKILMLLVLLVSLASANAQCNWSKIGFYYSNKCGVVTFEMGSKDTCITYTTWRYNNKTKKLDTIAHDRVFTRTMDTGSYTFKTSFHNKCGKCDTFIYKINVYIGCDSSTASLIDFVKPEPKLIGVYDMMGRPVPYIRNEEILIYRYDDGTSKKILINQ